MERYSELLSKAVAAISEGRDRSSIDAFLEGDEEPLFKVEDESIGDFELISFFVVKGSA